MDGRILSAKSIMFLMSAILQSHSAEFYLNSHSTDPCAANATLFRVIL